MLDFTDDIVRSVRAGDETLAAMPRRFTGETVVDLIYMIGYYMTGTRILETGGVDMEAITDAWRTAPGTSAQ